MTRRELDFSVLICAYTEDRWADLVAAVASVERQTTRAREIVIAVDHNPALLVRARREFTTAVVVENQETQGLSGTRNSGLAMARAEIVAFLDDDATAAPEWLERLAEGYLAEDRAIGVGGSIRPLWSEEPPRWFPEEFLWVVGCTYRGMPQVGAQVRNLIGANMSFRREIFQAIGGFRSTVGRVGTYPSGCEETEFCIRATRARPQGLLIYRPDAVVLHRVPADRVRWRYFRSRCYAEGLSKATVTDMVGAGAGLASERNYTIHALPKGIWRSLQQAAAHREPGAALRAAAIGAGLAVTAQGYARGAIRRRAAGAPRVAKPRERVAQSAT